MNSKQLIQKFARNIAVLGRYPEKRKHYLKYLLSMIPAGAAVARIPVGGRIQAGSFSEYLSILNLLPNNEEMLFIQNTLRHAEVAFDIGANVGSWSVIMNKLAPHCKIYAFEPVPATFRSLERNIEINQATSVTAVNAAAADLNGHLSFEVPGNVSIYARLAPQKKALLDDSRFSAVTSIQVESLRLADFARLNKVTKIDFIKLDVEGFELSVLRGLGEFFETRRVGAVHIETIRENHDRAGESFEELLRYVHDCGYSFYLLNGQGQPTEKVPFDCVRHHNHICLPDPSRR